METSKSLYDNLPVYRQINTSLQVESPQQDVLRYNGIDWDIKTSKQLPILSLTGSGYDRVLAVQKEISAASNPIEANDGLSEGHLQASRFISNKWDMIVPILRTMAIAKDEDLPTVEECISTEVDLRLPMFGGEIGHTLDCFGNDRHGNFYVIEIGRGNKSDQLARQLYLAKVLYPDVSLNGVVAKYTKTGEKDMRLYLRLV